MNDIVMQVAIHCDRSDYLTIVCRCKIIPIRQATTMWEHSRAVAHVVCGLRSEGICAMHGIDNHVCTIYTASEDR